MILTGETEVLGEKPVQMPLFFPTSLTWNDLGSNPGLRGERPAINRLRHGTAILRLKVT